MSYNKFINKILLKKFKKHKYQLCNTYIYDKWECDFFSIDEEGFGIIAPASASFSLDIRSIPSLLRVSRGVRAGHRQRNLV